MISKFEIVTSNYDLSLLKYIIIDIWVYQKWVQYDYAILAML